MFETVILKKRETNLYAMLQILTIYRKMKKSLIFSASYFKAFLLLRKTLLFQVTKQHIIFEILYIDI